MSTVTIHRPPPVEPVLEMMDRMDMQSIQRILDKAFEVKESYYGMRERELVAQIYSIKLPEGVYERCELLTNRLDKRGELNPVEQEEMSLLVDQFEMVQVERLALVVELAHLKQIDLDVMIASIKERDDLPSIDFPPRQHG